MPRKAGSPALTRRLGRRIRAYRELAGITQEKLAWQCDLNKSHLSQIENGKRMPSIPVLCEVAGVLGLHAADLLPFDRSDPHMALLDAARRRDRDGIAATLKRLGLG